jgi:hypothetical protein
MCKWVGGRGGGGTCGMALMEGSYLTWCTSPVQQQLLLYMSDKQKATASNMRC